MTLVGVYVAEVGRLHARLSLAEPMLKPPLDHLDVQRHTADYRWGPGMPASCSEMRRARLPNLPLSIGCGWGTSVVCCSRV